MYRRALLAGQTSRFAHASRACGSGQQAFLACPFRCREGSAR